MTADEVRVLVASIVADSRRYCAELRRVEANLRRVLDETNRKYGLGRAS